MARTFTLLLLFFLFGSPLAPRAGQDPSAGAATLPTCTTCKGKGNAVLPCDVCDGDGKAPCTDCASTVLADVQERQLAILRVTDAPKAKELEETLRKVAGSVSELNRLVGRLSPGGKPGFLPCPSSCKNGVSFLNPGHPCRPCEAKGSMKCKPCQGKGEMRCESCEGRRNREQPCPECAGCGLAPDPLRRTTDAAACAWCEGKQLLDCHVCDEGQLEQLCAHCRGAGDAVCRKCSGSTKMGCNKCSGTGDLSAYFGAKSSNDCDKCDKTGVLECSACTSGRISCEKCKGNRRLKGSCPTCLGTRHAPCGGCTMGSDRSWTTTAERLATAGSGPAALAHFDVALARIEARNVERVQAFEGTPKERDALAKELAKDTTALKNRRAQVAKKLGL